MKSIRRPSSSRAQTGFLPALIVVFIAAPGAFANWPFETQSTGCSNSVPEAQADGGADRLVRRTDFGATAELAPGSHRTPDIIGLRSGGWAPANPATSLFEGCWHGSADFVRVEIAFDGLQNPPGRVGLSTPDHAPFEYGPHPVSGFIEFDVDNNVDTGGDFNNPENTYVGNIARFGGLPQNAELHDRIAQSGMDLGGFVGAGPYVERSGEDFHLALFGDLIEAATKVIGDADDTFEAGEVWRVSGKLFHRAHGYAIFSGANGNGDYEPVVELEFRHDVATDVTVISFVYPLTNAAAAATAGQVAQSPDGNSVNQHSILEGLLDLQTSVMNLNPQLRNHPAFPLIAAWETQNPANYLNAAQWRITCHVGMSLPSQDPFGAFIAWTDAYPSAVAGDFNGDGAVTALDLAEFNVFVSQHDGLPPIDVDNAVNGRITLQDFGPNFSMFDIDNNGVVDADDFNAIPLDGDINGDRVVDLIDADEFVAILLGAPPPTPCNAAPPQSGACCIDAPFGPDLCFNSAPAECANQGGVFQGTGTTCMNDGCVLPVGACCAFGLGPATTMCFESTASDCLQIAGTFQGTGTLCIDPNLDCESQISAGACCFNSPAMPCQRVSPADCQSLGGFFQGFGTFCSDPQIPCTTQTDPVPCCNPLVGCILIDPFECLNQGGQPYPNAASCQAITCTPPGANGACCLASAGAVTCMDSTSASCFQMGGTFLGEATSCTNSQCGNLALRGCCIPGLGCRDLSVFDCFISGGTPEPVGAACSPNSCAFGGAALGACCLSIPGIMSDQCVLLSDLDCAVQAGTFSGPGTQCGNSVGPCSNPTPPLLTPPAFVDVLLGRVNDPTAIASADLNHDGVADGLDIPLYVEGLITNGFAADGACCLSSFTGTPVCFIASESDCTLASGTFRGVGTSCNNGMCPIAESIMMACCMPGGCADMTPSDCAMSGGASDPDALRCAQRARRNLLRKCDVNHDERVNGLDIQLFIARLMEN